MLRPVARGIGTMASGQLGGQMQALHAYSACDISDALLKLKVPGAGFVPDVLPFPHQINDATVVQRAKIIGPASTVLFVPKGHTGDTSVYPKANIPSDSHWVDLTKPDTVVVISSPKVDNAVVGGIMASRMSVRGARGIVVQGRCRDAEEMNALEIPIWATGSSTVGAGAGVKAHALEVPVTMSQTVIRPGDVMFCDPTEGVVAIPQDSVDAVLNLLPALVGADERVKDAVKQGISVQEAFHKYRTNS